MLVGLSASMLSQESSHNWLALVIMFSFVNKMIPFFSFRNLEFVLSDTSNKKKSKVHTVHSVLID